MSTPPTLLMGYGTRYLTTYKQTNNQTDKKQRQKHNLPVGGDDSSSTEIIRKTRASTLKRVV